MSTGTVDRPPIALPSRIGQATAVEQSRAVAEVQAAIVVAQQCPRNMQTVLAAMREACAQKGLAERAFYRYPRAGQTVTGPSIHFARELARCFGNVQYGIAELRRDDEHGQSEVQAYAWDVQTNTRSTTVFVVPHKRDTKEGVKPLVDMRDVYENNANSGARRLREMILAILPAWFVEEAKERCAATLTDGGGLPMATRVANSISHFAALGVTADQLEQKLGRPSARWTEFDLAALAVTHRSLQRGEVTREEEFPPPRVTVAEVGGTSDEPPARDEVIASVGAPKPLSDPQRKAINAIAPKIGLKDRDLLHHYLSEAVGRTINSVNDLTNREASTCIDLMQALERREQPGGE